MKPRLLIGLFGLSMLMNIFFVAGFAYSQFQLQRLGESLAARQEAIAQRLGLNDEQRFALAAIKQDVKKTVKIYKEQDGEALDEYWQIIAESSPDRERLTAVIQRMADNQKAYHQQLSDYILKFFATLNAQQREQFIEFARERNLFRTLVNRQS